MLKKPRKTQKALRQEKAAHEEMGLASSPDGKGILLSGDGTLVRSGASPSGIKNCDCRKKSIRRCDCPRRFSDPDARFGKDAHKDAYVFGYNMYTIVAITSSGPLPMASMCHGANTKRSLPGISGSTAIRRGPHRTSRPCKHQRIASVASSSRLPKTASLCCCFPQCSSITI